MSMQDLIIDQIINGLGTSYYLALKNRMILKELKNIQPKLKKDRPKYVDEMFIYLRDCSKNETILNISKLYDKSNDRKTRSINKLINQIKSSSLEIEQNEFYLDATWALFLARHKRLVNKFPELKTSPDCFFEIAQKIILDFEEKENLIGRVRIWRDKLIAHNERTALKISLEDEEIDTLLELAFFVLDFINYYVVSGSFVSVKNENPYFVTRYFQDYIN